MPAADPDRIIHCIKLDKDLPGLLKPPFPSELGKRIFAQFRPPNSQLEHWKDVK